MTRQVTEVIDDVLTGHLTVVQTRHTRAGRRFDVAAINTGTSVVGAVVYPGNLPGVLGALGDRWRPGTAVRATGRMDYRAAAPVLYVISVEPLQEPPRPVGPSCESCEVRPAVTRLALPDPEPGFIALCDGCLQDARALGLVDDVPPGGAQ